MLENKIKLKVTHDEVRALVTEKQAMMLVEAIDRWHLQKIQPERMPVKDSFER